MFAIAITLLVIEIKVPHVEPVTEAGLSAALQLLLPNYVGFLISFFVIGRFWIGHHRIFGFLKTFDNRLIQLNLLFLACIAFLPFPTAVIGEYGSAPTSIYFYIGCLAAAGLTNMALARYALANPAMLIAPLTPAERHETRYSWSPLVIAAAALIASQASPLIGLIVLSVSPLLFSLALWWWGRRYR